MKELRVTGFELRVIRTVKSEYFVCSKFFPETHKNIVTFIKPGQKGFAAGMMILICSRFPANQKMDPLCPLCLERSGW